jgi:hypothetical protein
MGETTVFKASMTCSGCANATKRILGKQGLSEVKVELYLNPDKSAGAPGVGWITVSADAKQRDEALKGLQNWATNAGKKVELSSAASKEAWAKSEKVLQLQAT